MYIIVIKFYVLFRFQKDYYEEFFIQVFENV